MHIIVYVIIHSIAWTYVPKDLFSHAVSYGTIISGPTLRNTVLDYVTPSLGLREHFRTKR